MRLRPIFRYAAPLMALLLVMACSDAGAPNNSSGALPTLTEPGFYALLSARPSAEENVVTLSLKQVPGGIEVASVQGEITYDATVLQLVRATLPEGIEGDAEEVAPGHVRFVGTLVQGAAEPPLLTLVFRGREKPVAPTRDMFSVRFEEVTGGADLSDLTGTVRTDQLLFVGGR
jgi:hypothetical protein